MSKPSQSSQSSDQISKLLPLLNQIEAERLSIKRILTKEDKAFESLTEEEFMKINETFTAFDSKFNDLSADVYKNIKKIDVFSSNTPSISSNSKQSTGKVQGIISSIDMNRQGKHHVKVMNKEKITEIKIKLISLNSNLGNINSELVSQGEKINNVTKSISKCEVEVESVEERLKNYNIKEKVYGLVLHLIVVMLFFIILYLVYERIRMRMRRMINDESSSVEVK
jgi:chromosome segregation ATPase